jgi:hypothetical protein
MISHTTPGDHGDGLIFSVFPVIYVARKKHD